MSRTTLDESLLSLYGDMGEYADWSQAKCVGCDPNLFFPDGVGGRPKTGAESQSKDNYERWPADNICPGCPIIDDCLSWALVNWEEGVWGGTTDEERQIMRLAGITGRRSE